MWLPALEEPVMDSRVVSRWVKLPLKRDPETKQMYVACECGERCVLDFQGLGGGGSNLCNCGRIYDNAGRLTAMPPADWREKR